MTNAADNGGIVITIRDIHRQVTETADKVNAVTSDVQVIKTQLNSSSEIPHEIRQLEEDFYARIQKVETRISGIDKIISAHSVIIGIITAAITIMVGRIIPW